MTSERLFNSFIHPQKLLYPQNKFLATPLVFIPLKISPFYGVIITPEQLFNSFIPPKTFIPQKQISGYAPAGAFKLSRVGVGGVYWALSVQSVPSHFRCIAVTICFRPRKVN